MNPVCSTHRPLNGRRNRASVSASGARGDALIIASSAPMLSSGLSRERGAGSESMRSIGMPGVVLASDLVTMACAYRNHGATW